MHTIKMLTSWDSEVTLVKETCPLNLTPRSCKMVIGKSLSFWVLANSQGLGKTLWVDLLVKLEDSVLSVHQKKPNFHGI